MVQSPMDRIRHNAVHPLRVGTRFILISVSLGWCLGCDPTSQNLGSASTGLAPPAASTAGDAGRENFSSGTSPSGSTAEPASATVAGIQDGPPPDADDFICLVLGNSHAFMAHPFHKLTEMIRLRPNADRVEYRLVNGLFLEELVNVPKDPAIFRPFPPQVVILQGQKYSMSGRTEYPIDTAVELVEQFNRQGCRVLLMPEWRTVGNVGEAQRATKIYERIADSAARTNQDAPVEVVPVGLVWDRVLDELPKLELHSRDGNHSNESGGYLTALTFYCWLYDAPPTGAPPQGLEKQADRLAEIALEVCRAYRAERAK